MKTKLASLSFEIQAINGKAPVEVRLMPAGLFNATDGRPREVPSRAWLINDAIAASVIDKLRAKQDDTVFDYNHSTLADDPEPESAIAAGWFHDMAYRADGLYAIGVQWTPRAEAFITNKEYRYISPVFSYSPDTGEVIEIISAALTNTPALDGLDDLMTALSKKQQQESIMPTEQLAALTAERDTAKAQVVSLTAELGAEKNKVAALTTERDALATKVAALEKEKLDTAAATEQQQCQDLLKAALSSGKVLPHMKLYLEKKTNVAELKEAIDAFGGDGLAKTLLSKQHQTDTQQPDATDAQLIADKATAYQVQQAALGIQIDDVTAISHVTKGMNAHV